METKTLVVGGALCAIVIAGSIMYALLQSTPVAVQAPTTQESKALATQAAKPVPWVPVFAYDSYMASEGRRSTIRDEADKPAHECVFGVGGRERVSADQMSADQMSAERIVLLTLGDAERSSLHYCFVSGYRGIRAGGCDDDYDFEARWLGHGLSDRRRAQCDAIMRRLEAQLAADAAKERRLDESYDRERGLQPKK